VGCKINRKVLAPINYVKFFLGAKPLFIVGTNVFGKQRKLTGGAAAVTLAKIYGLRMGQGSRREWVTESTKWPSPRTWGPWEICCRPIPLMATGCVSENWSKCNCCAIRQQLTVADALLTAELIIETAGCQLIVELYTLRGQNALSKWLLTSKLGSFKRVL